MTTAATAAKLSDAASRRNRTQGRFATEQLGSTDVELGGLPAPGEEFTDHVMDLSDRRVGQAQGHYVQVYANALDEYQVIDSKENVLAAFSLSAHEGPITFDDIDKAAHEAMTPPGSFENPTWTPASLNADPAAPYQGGYRGSKYDGNRKMAEVKKLIKADIVHAIEGGYLPAEYDYDVKASDRYGTISVTASDVPVEKVYLGEPSGLRRHPFTQELETRMRHIIAQYNFDHSDSQQDYFHSGFHDNTSVRTDLSKAHAEFSKLSEGFNSLTPKPGVSMADLLAAHRKVQVADAVMRDADRQAREEVYEIDWEGARERAEARVAKSEAA